jgi:hypothetical protein
MLALSESICWVHVREALTAKCKPLSRRERGRGEGGS